MSVFFDVPKSQQIELLNEWLEIDDIITLDTALCNRQFRPQFLALVAAPECALDHFVFRNKDDSAGWDRWTVQRGVKYRKATMGYIALKDNHLREQLIRTIGSQLKSLTISFEYPYDDDDQPLIDLPADLIYLDIAQYCPMLTSLSIKEDESGGSGLATVIINCKQLLNLTLWHCSHVSSSVLKAICSSLSIKYWQWYDGGSFVNNAFEFGARGCVNLTSLSINWVQLSDQQVQHLLKYMPNLTTLCLAVESCHGVALSAEHCVHITNVTLMPGSTAPPLQTADAVLISKYWTKLEEFRIYQRSVDIQFTEQEVACDQTAVMVLVQIVHCCKNWSLHLRII